MGAILPQTITVGGDPAVFSVENNFSDPDGDTLTYFVTSSDSSKVNVSASGAEVTFMPAGAGSASVTIMGSDGALAATHTVSVTVLPQPNRAPTAVGSIGTVALTVGEDAATVELSTYFTDPDKDSLVYAASVSDVNKVSVNVTDDTLAISALASGRATVTASASDGSLSAAQTISVTIAAAARVNSLR